MVTVLKTVVKLKLLSPPEKGAFVFLLTIYFSGTTLWLTFKYSYASVVKHPVFYM
jgi:hypothetical protein